jgi:predicted RNase H-like HicB family nuclease
MAGHPARQLMLIDDPVKKAGQIIHRIQIAPMKFVITLDRDEDGVWIAECPSIPGCISQGATKDEAAANLHEAILGCLEVRAEQGMPLTVETRLLEVAVA